MYHRLLLWTMLAGLALAPSACGKPKAEDCEKAVANIRNLYGTATTTQGVAPRAAVRSCRGSATRESVRCIIDAESIEELEACTGGGEFLETLKGEAEDSRDSAQEGETGEAAKGEAEEPRDSAQEGEKGEQAKAEQTNSAQPDEQTGGARPAGGQTNDDEQPGDEQPAGE